jgi:hypothetical protein
MIPFKSTIIEEFTNEGGSPNATFSSPVVLDRGGESDYLPVSSIGNRSRSPSPRIVYGGGFSSHSPTSKLRSSTNRYYYLTNHNSPSRPFKLVP